MAWLYQMQAANGQLQSNLTTGGPLLDNAVMVYIRAGSQGVLVAFGGTNVSLLCWQLHEIALITDYGVATISYRFLGHFERLS